ncbi:MAG: RNA methyltransferase [Rikenellaceae bacterium]|nr:RNA methyltransferase [Rikenellaceae bacterium]
MTNEPTKARVAFVRSLRDKRCRDESGLFVAEGAKLVGDLLAGGMEAEAVYVTGDASFAVPVERVSPAVMARMSHLKSPSQVLAVMRKREAEPYDAAWRDGLVLVLDGVQDPGNLGTIIRAADWFGIEHIICSPSTADLYNAKTVQATMGSLCRVSVRYAPLEPLIERAAGDGVPVYGTFLDGDDIYTAGLSDNGLIIMGNEGNGISGPVAAKVTHRLLIPSYPEGRPTGESLNVGVAAAVVCSVFRGRGKTAGGDLL